MKQNDRKVNKYKIKTKEGMKKRKSSVTPSTYGGM